MVAAVFLTMTSLKGGVVAVMMVVVVVVPGEDVLSVASTLELKTSATVY